MKNPWKSKTRLLQSSSIASAQACNSQSRASAAYIRGLSIARLSISL